MGWGGPKCISPVEGVHTRVVGTLQARGEGLRGWHPPWCVARLGRCWGYMNPGARAEKQGAM